MLQDTLTPRHSPPRTGRSYSLQFKARLVAVCERLGAPVASLAGEHGVDANVLHRWRKEHRQSLQSPDAESARFGRRDIYTYATTARPSRAQTGAVVVNSTPAFVAINLGLLALHIAHAVRPHEAPLTLTTSQ